MKLDDLRSILLSERETGRLTATTPDIFERGHEELSSLMARVYELDDPLSDEARSLIEETLAIKETLHELFALRCRKILALTIMHAEGNYYDRGEVKRTISAEREMFDRITAAIEECQGILLYNVPHLPVTAEAEVDESAEPGPEAEGAPAASGPALHKLHLPGTHPCVLVRALEDMDSFMGVDGRIYTLSKGDIVTLPERNAAVLSERNIVLNINLCK